MPDRREAVRQIEGLLFLAGWLLGGEGIETMLYRLTCPEKKEEMGWVTSLEVEQGIVREVKGIWKGVLEDKTLEEVQTLADDRGFRLERVE